MFYIGYKQNITLTYNNIYLDKKGKHLLSLSYYFNKQHQLNYITLNNKHSEIKLNNSFEIEKEELIIQYKYRYNLNTENTFFLKNETLKINDSIYLLNNNHLSGLHRVRFLQLLYEFEKKYWDNKSYPLNGYYLKINILKNGIIPKFDNVNSFYFKIQINKYFQLNKKFYFATKISAKLYIPKNQAYFMMDTLGNNDYIRGFEYYVIDGNMFIINNNSLKFELLPEKIFYLKKIPLKSFNKIPLRAFLTINFDYGYVKDFSFDFYYLNNKLANRFLYSFGIGIDFVTYYDKILRIEHSFNSIGENDFFLHFKSLF